MPAPALQFWYEFGSTYSYLSVMRLEEAAQEAGVKVEWRPFLLGPVFKAQGWDDSPFNLYPQKGRYMWRDLERRAERYGSPFRRPSVFPRNGLHAARLALLGCGPGWAADFSRQVFTAHFTEDADISDPAFLHTVLAELGLDAQSTWAESQGEPHKNALRAQTEAAQQMGIFGAPTFAVGEELFWGDDRLEDALDWARGRSS